MSNPGGPRAAEEEPRVLGVRLDRYAGVTAALGEGIPLREVLAQERIDEAAWPAADRAWKEALVDAPDLHLRYMKLRRQAEDCLSRQVDPLVDDPAAWAGLLGAVSLSDDPDRVLQSLGLRMTDMARLGRSWRHKAERDPKVAERLSDLAGKAKPPTAVRCGPTTLRRFPWSPPAEIALPPLAESPRATGAPDLAAPLPDSRARPEPLPSYLAAQSNTALPATMSPGAAVANIVPLNIVPPNIVSPNTVPPSAVPSVSPRPGRGATIEMSMSSLPGAPTLPFAGGEPRPPDVPAPARARVDTGTVDASDGNKPPDPGAEGKISGFTLAQYASLSAELGADPAGAPAILARYGLAGEAARARLAEAWNGVLLRDGALRARWMQLTIEFRAWLAQQRRPSGG